MIGKAIYNLLSNDTDVSALVSDRIFPSIAVGDVVYPYIVYDKTSHTAEDQKDGVSCMDIIEYDIEIYSEDNVQLEDLGVKVRNVLDRYSGTVEGLEIQSSKFMDEEMGYSDADRVYLKMQAYSFRFIPIYGVLPAITSLAAVASSTTQIDLTWTDNSTGESGFEVWRSTNLSSWTLITTTAANATSYNNTGLTASTQYYYRVRPTDGTNGSQWSNIVGMRTDNAGGGVVPAGILYQRPPLTGQLTSFRTGDDAWHLTNGTYTYTGPANPATKAQLDYAALDPFRTLKSNNAFGNLNRFTDELGLQTYTNGWAVDHLSGLIYKIALSTQVNWNTAIDNGVADTSGGYSWRVTNVNEAIMLMDREIISGFSLDYAPFNVDSTSNFHSSTTKANNTINSMTNNFANGFINQLAKATIGRYLLVANFYS